MIAKLGKLSLIAGALALGACEAVTGVNDGEETRVVLVRSGSGSASLSPAFNVVAAAGLPPVALSNVSSIDITITKVQALPAASDTASEGQWVTLDLTAPQTVNFLALPTDATTGGLDLARGDLPAGSYGNVRLLFSDASITFKEPVTVGQTTYPANEKIQLEIPSGKVRIPTAGFTVGAESGATVRLVFDASASVNKIIATGANKVKMPPVLTARTDDGSDD